MKTVEEIKKGLVEAIEEASWVVEGGDAHDLIDAVDKAHASMADALAYIQQLEHKNKDLLEERELNEHLRDKVQQLEAQVPKWISVEERLPKRNQRVVVTDDKRAWDYGQFSGLAFCFEKDNPNPREWNWKKHTVRHVEWWMPKETALPEPPKEG